MRTLLQIDSSPRLERSHSRQLTAHFAGLWRRAHPDGAVIHRELGLIPVPLISEDWIAAAFSKPVDRTPAQRAAIAVSDELIDELMAADELVIGAPMYNFGVSASLKAWIDQIVRIGRTVEYPSYTGLVTGRKATIIATRGLRYERGGPMAEFDAQVPYLKRILGFIGITDVSVVCVDGLAGADQARQESMDRARAEVDCAARQ